MWVRSLEKPVFTNVCVSDEFIRMYTDADSVEFSLKDITSDLDVPRLNSLTVELQDD